MDESTAQKDHFHVGDRVKILLSGPSQTFTITGIARYGTLEQPRRRDHRRLRSTDRSERVQQDRAVRRDRRGGPTGGGQVRGPAGHRQGAPPWGRGGHRADRGKRGDQPDQPGALLLLDRAARVRVHRPLRRRLHHPQHLLDHRGAADPRAGAPADRRCKSTAGVPFGPRRSGDRRPGVLAHRHRARRALRDRSRSPATRIRSRPPHRCAGVRGANRDRRAHRGSRGDRRRRDQPRTPRGADPSSGGDQRTADRRRRLLPAPVRVGSLPRAARRPPARDRTCQARDPVGRARCGGSLRRRGHAVAGGRATALQRDRTAARPLARGVRAPGPRELDAEPAPDRSDRVRADGRACARLRHRGVRCVAVTLRHQQRGQRDRGRPDRDQHQQQRLRSVQQFGGADRSRRSRCEHHDDGLRRPVRIPGRAAINSPRSRLRTSPTRSSSR